MPTLDLGTVDISGHSSSLTTPVINQVRGFIFGKSFTNPGSIEPGFDNHTLSSTSNSVCIVSSSSAIRIQHPSATRISLSTRRSELANQYPISSAQRTADEIANVLKMHVPGVALITARELPFPYGKGYPLVQVSPALQRVHQAFVGGPFGGLSGNQTGVFDRYAIRYVGLPVQELEDQARQDKGAALISAQNMFYLTMENIIRAIKYEPLGAMGGTVIRLGDEIDIQYSEGGSHINWQNQPRIGGVMLVSVMEVYRPYYGAAYG